MESTVARESLWGVRMDLHGKKTRFRLLVSTAAVLAAGSGAAWADAPVETNQPPPPPPGMLPPPPGVVPQPLYPTPLSQTVQTTYVPQSVALSGPEQITDDVEGRPPPAGYTAVHRRRKGLLIAGPILLGATYGYTSLIAAIGTDLDRSTGGNGSSVAPLFIPVLGPFLEMGETDSYAARYLLAIDGAAQAAGALMLYYGLTTTKTVFIRNDLLYSVNLTPMVAPHGSGLALSGRF
jgi:hypothetical protein